MVAVCMQRVVIYRLDANSRMVRSLALMVSKTPGKDDRLTWRSNDFIVLDFGLDKSDGALD